MEPPHKRRKKLFSVHIPECSSTLSWESPFNKEGKVTISTDELGDGATSRVYRGIMNGEIVAVKKLKGFVPSYASALINAYEKFLPFHHPKVVQIFGLCPSTGWIVLELCEKILGGKAVHSLSDLMALLGNDKFSTDLRVTVLADVIEGVEFLHSKGMIHGDIKPLNVLVSGCSNEEFVFKVTDYANQVINPSQTSHSTTLRQLMTPGYTAPELLPQANTITGFVPRPNKSSDIYSFAILAYEVVFMTQAWGRVDFTLLDSVRNGSRPQIPLDADPQLRNLIEKSWIHDSKIRPTASEVSLILEEYLSQPEVHTVPQIEEENDHTRNSPARVLVATPNMGRCDPNSCYSTTLSQSQSSLVDLLSSNSDISCQSQFHQQLPTLDPIALLHSDPQSIATVSACSKQDASQDIMINSQTSSGSPTDSQLPSPTRSRDSIGSNIVSTPMLSVVRQLDQIKATLKIANYKDFQMQTIEALQSGKDAIVVQPTGSGKSVCYTAPALLNPGKITVIVEPAVSIISNQVQGLTAKGIDAVALGRAAGNSKLSNFRRVFRSTSNIPILAFCTPEYLFGIAESGVYKATAGQFSELLKQRDNLHLVAIDEAHKIFDRLPSFRPAFDSLRKLQQLPCTLLAMSATLTNTQIDVLRKDFLHGDNCVILTKDVHRDNLVIQLRRYNRQSQKPIEEGPEVEDEDDDDKVTTESITSRPQSLWEKTALEIKRVVGGKMTVVYLDFVRDVEHVVDVLHRNEVKAVKYTGQMTIEDRATAETIFLNGYVDAIVATESFELGINNPKVTQVVRIGCPRNLGVLLQEFGRAGRKAGVVANGYLYFNECIDDKRLGLWLKSSLDASNGDDAHESVKQEVLQNYILSWKFIYSAYHGKCLALALSHFYGGAGNFEAVTCIVSNSSLCMICEASDAVCEEMLDIKGHLCVLLNLLKHLHTDGVSGVSKTLLVGILTKATSRYVCEHRDIVDLADVPWGCGMKVNGAQMTGAAWCKVIYVAIHLSFVEISFSFRPYENHYEVHRHLQLSSAGEEFILSPSAVMSVDPLSYIIDNILASKSTSHMRKRTCQNRGIQLKPRLTKIFESQSWMNGDVDLLKFIGIGETKNEVSLYFPDSRTLASATPDPHYLLHCLQLSRIQSVKKEFEVCLNGQKEILVANRSYCAGVKICAEDKCEYTVSNKQKVNRCPKHPKMGLILTGPCPCHLVYLYPKSIENDGRRWFVALSADNEELHNHPPPSEWKITPKVLCDLAVAVTRNTAATPKNLQKGVGMNYCPIEASLPAANIDRVRAVVKKVRKDADKIDNERVNPFNIIASFSMIKEKLDEQHCKFGSNAVGEVNKLIGTYQLDGDSAYSFSRDRRLAFFQAPFQVHHWHVADALFVDIDYTGNHHFPYLLNVVCFNSTTKRYMACGRVLMNRQDGDAIGKALLVLSDHVKEHHPRYDIKTAHKEILLDFDEAESNGFRQVFGDNITNLIRGCSVHFLRSAMRVAKLCNHSCSSLGYQMFVAIAKLIPDNLSTATVKKAFDILSGSEVFTSLSSSLPSPLSDVTTDELDTETWIQAKTWTHWWTRPTVLKKLCKAYTSISCDDWDELPGTNNPVESINRQSVPDNLKSVSLRPLVEHVYMEDRRQATLQVATDAGISISYGTRKRKRTRRHNRVPERSSSLLQVPAGKNAIGLRVTVEFYADDSQETTKWYKGTVISYSQGGYVVTFDGCGPEENETIRSLQKAMQKGDVKLL